MHLINIDEKFFDDAFAELSLLPQYKKTHIKVQTVIQYNVKAKKHIRTAHAHIGMLARTI